ncbi:ABC transporter permease [Litorimonas sp. RW-G-Af-16]|uniref:ABC transporter permease n=1 Tax=Litorimonas sp. RW-G-Af-16 TaxID=3241168 RepID=UPI00390C5496
MIERMVAMRYLRAKKTQGGVGLIAAISFTCIMLAIAAMIIIMSIMNGFRSEMIRLTIGSEGHMYVASAAPSPSPESMIAMEQRLAAVPGVDEAYQFTQHYTGVQANGQFGLAQVIGIRPQNLRSYELISQKIVEGSLDGFGQGAGANHQIAMGQRLAASLGLSAGDRLTIFSPRTRATPFAGPMPITKTYTVGAVFEIGILQTDQTYIFMDFDQATLLFEGGKVTGEVQIRLNDADDINKLYEPISNAAEQPVFISTWKDKNASVATALRTEQIAMRFIFMIVVIIAAFPVLASMIMLVKNKSKDIAILRTIGATQGGILRIFLMSGAMIGILGTLAGLIIGILFCLNIGTVQSTIEFVCRCELFPADVYQLSSGIPAKIVWSEVAGVAFWGFLISAAATFLPAISASRVDPVDALRYE